MELTDAALTACYKLALALILAYRWHRTHGVSRLLLIALVLV